MPNQKTRPGPRYALMLAALMFAPAAQADQSFSIVQDLPAIVHVDLGAEGASHGDLTAFEAPFVAEDGTEGIMRGIIVTVEIPLPGEQPFVDRISQIVLEFGQSDTLVVGGGATYTDSDAEMDVNTPHVRAVMGGTGRFIGASGQMTTIRRDAGHYEHTLILLD